MILVVRAVRVAEAVVAVVVEWEYPKIYLLKNLPN